MSIVKKAAGKVTGPKEQPWMAGAITVTPLPAELSEPPAGESELRELIQAEVRAQALRDQEFLRRMYAYYHHKITVENKGWCSVTRFRETAGFIDGYRSSDVTGEAAFEELLRKAFPRGFSQDLSIYNVTGLQRVREALREASVKKTASMRSAVIKYTARGYIDKDVAERFYADFGVEPPRSRRTINATVDVNFTLKDDAEVDDETFANALKALVKGAVPADVLETDTKISAYASSTVSSS